MIYVQAIEVKRRSGLRGNTVVRGKRPKLGNVGAVYSSDRSRKRIYYQCLRCGAPANPMYGEGDDSWCPDCGHTGYVYSCEGRLPYPALYATWEESHQSSASSKAEGALTNPVISDPVHGATATKRMKSHSGTYSCLNCCIEFDLVAVTQLKCDECGGPLIKGELEDFVNEIPPNSEENP